MTTILHMGKRKRRTKKQKVIAQMRRKRGNDRKVSLEIVEKKSINLKKKIKKISTSEFFSYDPKLIVDDLKRTIIMSLVILGVELGLWIYFS